ncbi:MAG: S8 family serine peptidase [Crocinitomicaceae bacterium]|nr:S8 family serine peptidase [Crocinitomicaceae bacterium]MBT6514243.1 S8 family serine peptidase [Crocinitomicaceae bacterium]
MLDGIIRYSIISLLLLVGSNYAAQTLTDRLNSRIEKMNNTNFQRIRVEFEDNVDCYYWNQQFKQEQILNTKRPPLIINKLQTQSNESQLVLINNLKTQFPIGVKSIQQFWIVNILVLEANPEAIHFISTFPGVALIDLEESKIQMNEHFTVAKNFVSKAIGSPEPGLIAINAPALWAMGYTGRGTVVYDYDTGVWPDHPAFSDRFMGNYFPLSQSWLGYYKENPTGLYNSHGTHTLGTMAGLDTTLNDTIGCAFGAYWIACDHIRSSVAELPPITDMVMAFEWALDPDGNPSTTHDIPDVINNSWRWYDDADTNYCSGFVVNLMNAIEAAGIANVFSGGNFGPSNTTISSPQRINTSDVNTFSVGSVNGNASFPYPISSFSSIGPKQCPGSGSLEIHPEVVAPGQNVRSAWGPSGYNSISGTSMAAPHVSGACLLLKEAFPTATGEDILRALYTTATDLGTAGEDNTYGMGIINCLSAFNELSLSYTPSNPNSVAWDLAVFEVINPSNNEVTCNTVFTPSIILINKGDSAITNITIVDSLLGASNTTFWSGILLPGQQATVNLPSFSSSTEGLNEYFITTTINDAGADDIDIYNNRRIIRFNIRPEKTVPYLEKFESGISEDWLIVNPDDNYTWEADSTAGLPWNHLSATIQHFWYNPIVDQEDELISPNIATAGASQLHLKFDRAYENLNSSSRQDTLVIYLSTDCGETWPIEIYKKWGVNLASIDTVNIAFTPSQSHHWETDSIDITAYNSSTTIMVKFMSKNRKGQNLYLDNIRIFESQDPVLINDSEKNVFSIYPNPTDNICTIILHDLNVAELKLFNLNGKLLDVFPIKNRATLDLSIYPSGLYVIKAGREFKSIIKR